MGLRKSFQALLLLQVREARASVGDAEGTIKQKFHHNLSFLGSVEEANRLQ